MTHIHNVPDGVSYTITHDFYRFFPARKSLCSQRLQSSHSLIMKNNLRIVQKHALEQLKNSTNYKSMHCSVPSTLQFVGNNVHEFRISNTYFSLVRMNSSYRSYYMEVPTGSGVLRSTMTNLVQVTYTIQKNTLLLSDFPCFVQK